MDSKYIVMWVFLGVIVLAAILYLIGYGLRRRNYTRLDELEKRKSALFELPIYDEVDDVKRMHLVGQSQNTFREWNERWNDLSTRQFAELESRIFDVENLNDSFRFVRVKTEMLEAEEAMTKMEDEVADIRQGLADLQESEARNSMEVQRALDIYEEISQALKENASTFGPSLKELQKQVKNIETEFTQFVALNTAGDPIEARDVLEQAEQHTYEVEDAMNRVPAAFEQLHKHFPEDIKDLTQGHDQMKKQAFKFPVKSIDDELKKVKNKVKTALSDLERCEVDAAENAIVSITEDIERLYTIMEKEADSKQYVVTHQKRLDEFIQHAAKNNRQLSIELDHTSQSYALNHNELGRCRGFQAQIDDLTKQFSEMEPKIAAHELVYSEVEQMFKNNFQILEEIETQQVEIDKRVQELRKGEKDAHKSLEGYEFSLRNLKRYVDQQRLPGLPGDYLEFFFVATERIETLGGELNKIRIDVDRINQLVDLCKEDIEVLEQKTHELVDSAALTEQMLQYANRYRHTHPAISEAIDHALELFSKQYRYRDALDEIGTALEKVEPGAFKRIESFYFNNREMV